MSTFNITFCRSFLHPRGVSEALPIRFAPAQSNLIVLAPPAQCAHKAAPFLGKIIKRRGLLPHAEISGTRNSFSVSF